VVAAVVVVVVVVVAACRHRDAPLLYPDCPLFKGEDVHARDGGADTPFLRCHFVRATKTRSCLPRQARDEHRNDRFMIEK